MNKAEELFEEVGFWNMPSVKISVRNQEEQYLRKLNDYKKQQKMRSKGPINVSSEVNALSEAIQRMKDNIKLFKKLCVSGTA
jgi:hypothetical protein